MLTAREKERAIPYQLLDKHTIDKKMPAEIKLGRKVTRKRCYFGCVFYDGVKLFDGKTDVFLMSEILYCSEWQSGNSR